MGSARLAGLVAVSFSISPRVHCLFGWLFTMCFPLMGILAVLERRRREGRGISRPKAPPHDSDQG